MLQLNLLQENNRYGKLFVEEKVDETRKGNSLRKLQKRRMVRFTTVIQMSGRIML